MRGSEALTTVEATVRRWQRGGDDAVKLGDADDTWGIVTMTENMRKKSVGDGQVFKN